MDYEFRLAAFPHFHKLVVTRMISIFFLLSGNVEICICVNAKNSLKFYRKKNESDRSPTRKN